MNAEDHGAYYRIEYWDGMTWRRSSTPYRHSHDTKQIMHRRSGVRVVRVKKARSNHAR